MLLGTIEEPQMSTIMRSTFLKYAKKHDDGEYYLGEGDFIDAVAPESEDYVRNLSETCRVNRANGVPASSTRSSAPSTASCLPSPTAIPRVASVCRTGLSSRICSRNQTPSTRSFSAFSTATGRDTSTSTSSLRHGSSTRGKTACRSTGTRNGRLSTSGPRTSVMS